MNLKNILIVIVFLTFIIVLEMQCNRSIFNIWNRNVEASPQDNSTKQVNHYRLVSSRESSSLMVAVCSAKAVFISSRASEEALTSEMSCSSSFPSCDLIASRSFENASWRNLMYHPAKSKTTTGTPKRSTSSMTVDTSIF